MIIAENLAETNPVAIDVAIRQPFLYAILATAENHQQELAQCNDKKAKKAFIKVCGGASKVEPFQKVLSFWKSLSQEVQEQILNLSSGVIEKKEWLALAQLSVEKVTQWCQGVLNGSEIISPKAWLEEINKLNPNPKPKKLSLKLGKPVENQHFNALLDQKEYDFTPDKLEEFKAKFLASADPAIPLITEDLLVFLKDRGLDPLVIISPRDGVKWLGLQLTQQEEIHQQKLTQQAQKFTQQLEQQQQQNQNEIAQLREHFKQELQQQLDQRDLKHQNEIAQHQTEINELKEQMKELMKHLQPA